MHSAHEFSSAASAPIPSTQLQATQPHHGAWLPGRKAAEICKKTWLECGSLFNRCWPLASCCRLQSHVVLNLCCLCCLRRRIVSVSSGVCTSGPQTDLDNMVLPSLTSCPKAKRPFCRSHASCAGAGLRGRNQPVAIKRPSLPITRDTPHAFAPR